MALDVQAIMVATAGILTAVGAIFTGWQTGRNSRVKDRQVYDAQVEQFRISREVAEEIASKGRVEALAQDAVTARTRLREIEAAHHEENLKWYAARREMEYDVQRGWDLARFYFGLLTAIMHIMNNVFGVMELAGDDSGRIASALRSAAARMRDIKVPTSLEEPIPDERKQK